MRRTARGSATTPGCTPPTGSSRRREALAAKGAELVAVKRNPIDAVWADRPEPSQGAADRPARRAMPASRRPRSATRWPTGWPRKAPMRRCWRRSIRSPGPSTSAAPTSPTRRSRWPSRWSTPTAPPTCSSTARRSATTSRSISATASGCTSATSSRPYLKSLTGKLVAVDPERSVAAIFEALDKAARTIVSRRDPAVLPKAVKNPVEIAGHKAAQARDGAAVSRFLNWVEEEAPKGGSTRSSPPTSCSSLRQRAAASRT